jgi:hypothetical protein
MKLDRLDFVRLTYWIGALFGASIPIARRAAIERGVA